MKKTILYLGNKLASKGFTPTGIDTLGPKLENLGFTVFYASSKRAKLARLLDMVWVLVKKNSEVDHVIIDTYSTQNFWFAYAAARLCQLFNLKYIPVLHGGNLPERIKNSKKASDVLFENAFKIIAPSNYLACNFEQAGYKRITVVPNALALNQYTFKFREEFQPKLLWVRSFASIYNPMLALDILEEMLVKFPEAQLCMIGPDKDGSLEICKTEAAKKNLPVTFTGKLQKSKWLDLASEYDIFINTTHVDNTPVSVIEAMALGLPVISTAVGGIPFIITNKENGLLVNDSDCNGFVTAIQTLLGDRKLAKQISNTAYAYTRQYDWEAVKNHWVNILT